MGDSDDEAARAARRSQQTEATPPPDPEAVAEAMPGAGPEEVAAAIQESALISELEPTFKPDPAKLERVRAVDPTLARKMSARCGGYNSAFLRRANPKLAEEIEAD